ncbi:MAG: hypothetical protein HRT88_00855 [Lentisphaeraceae bacterium]|nr:hypothetical protein [Lentisphaeraceae bacterium]
MSGKRLQISLEEACCWRNAILNYRRDFGISKQKTPGTVLLKAPDSSGTLYLDLIAFAQIFPRGSWPKPGEAAKKAKEGLELFEKTQNHVKALDVGPISAADLKWVQDIRNNLVLKKVQWTPAEQEEQANKAIKFIEHFIGTAEKSGNFLSSVGLNVEGYDRKALHPLSHPAGEVAGNQQEKELAGLAKTYANLTEGNEPQKRLGRAILRLLDYYQLQRGSAWRISAQAVVALKDLLIENNRYQLVLPQAIRVPWPTQPIFDKSLITLRPNDGRVNCDIEALGWGGGKIIRQIRQIFLLESNLLIAKALKTYKLNFNRSMRDDNWAAGYMNDGSIMHHGVPNWAYASYCFPGFFDNLKNNLLPYKIIDEKSLAFMKRVLMRSEVYSAGTHVPFALRARWLQNNYRNNPENFRKFALYASLSGQIDRDAAGAYLHLNPKAAKEKAFADQGIQARPVPEQTFSMPWSCMLTHRRRGFLVNIKGFNKVVAAVEMQGSNRLARYLSHGIMEISNNRHGKALRGEALTASGFSFKGLDWNHLPGTTSKEILPFEKLHRNIGRARSKEAFAGSVAHRNRHGLFAMKLRDVVDKNFVARKSYFLFDKRIICLGSDIHCDDDSAAVHTTLFQKSLAKKSTPVIVNGKRVTAFPANMPPAG